MMSLLGSIGAVLAIVGVGLGLSTRSALAGPEWVRPWPFRLAWAWGLGTAACGTLLTATGVVLGTFSVIPVYLLLAVVWAWRGPASPRQRASPGSPPSLPGRLAVYAAVLLLSLITLRGLDAPLGWDGWAVWAIKARAIHTENRLDTLIMRDLSSYGFSHPDYPPLVPVLEAFLFAHAGGPFERRLGLLHAAWGWMVWALVLLLARRRFGDPAGPAVALLAMLQGTLEKGLVDGTADVPVLGYSLMLLALLVEPRRDDGPAAALALAGALLTKNEGLVVFIAAVLALALRSGRLLDRSTGAVALAALAAYLPWWWLCRRHGVVCDLTVNGAAPAADWPGRVSGLITGIGRSVLAVDRLGPLWWVVIAGLVLGPAVDPPFVFVGLLAAGLVAPYVWTWKDQTWLIEHSLDRVLGQVLPLIVLVGGRLQAGCPTREDDAHLGDP